MRCRVARARIHAALERELALEQRFELEAHVAGCAPCAELERRARALQELLEGPGDPPPAAPDVDAAARVVLARLERGEGEPWRPRRERRFAPFAVGALAAAAAVALALLVARDDAPAPNAPSVARDSVTEPETAPEPETPPPAEPAASEWTAASVEATVRPALLELFDSDGVDVERALAAFAERTREPARAGWPVRRFVEGLLESPDARVALGAARCLGAQADPGSVAALERALARPRLAGCALEALGALGEPAVPALERALSEPELAARGVLELCRIGGPRAALALERAARSARAGSDPSREALLDALTTTGPSAVASLLRLAAEAEREPGGRVESGALLARLALVDGGGAELTRCVTAERLPGDLAYRALFAAQPREALPWLAQRCLERRERAAALETLAAYRGPGPLRVALELARGGRVPRADVLALTADLLERGADQDDERAELLSRELAARGDAAALRAWLELLIESEHPHAARALVPLVSCAALADDDRQWAALAIGELGAPADAERLAAELPVLAVRPEEGAPGDERRVAACLLSIHALLGDEGVERVLEPFPPAGARRVLAALGGERRGDAVLVHRVARALEGARDELARASDDDKEIL